MLETAKRQKVPGSGRKKGTANKATIARESAIAESGMSPLDYMLAVMRDETADSARRDRMAQAAAPFVHPKIAAIEKRDNDPFASLDFSSFP